MCPQVFLAVPIETTPLPRATSRVRRRLFLSPPSLSSAVFLRLSLLQGLSSTPPGISGVFLPPGRDLWQDVAPQEGSKPSMVNGGTRMSGNEHCVFRVPVPPPLHVYLEIVLPKFVIRISRCLTRPTLLFHLKKRRISHVSLTLRWNIICSAHTDPSLPHLLPACLAKLWRHRALAGQPPFRRGVRPLPREERQPPPSLTLSYIRWNGDFMTTMIFAQPFSGHGASREMGHGCNKSNNVYNVSGAKFGTMYECAQQYDRVQAWRH